MTPPLDSLFTMPTEDDGIEILVQMAKGGQLDPWDVDLVLVADRYLAEVEKRQDDDLELTGKTLLYLAILLRMKSDLLAGFDPLAMDEDDPFMGGIEDADLSDIQGVDAKPFLRLVKPKTLDDVLERRTSVKQHRIRRVTLDDLIQELKKYEILERQRSLRQQLETETRRRETMVDYGSFTNDDIEAMAHEESLEDAIERISVLLKTYWDAAPLRKEAIQQEQAQQGKAKASPPPADVSHTLPDTPQEALQRAMDSELAVSLTQVEEWAQVDRITAFLSLLFLEARFEVEMLQDDFYTGEITLVPYNETMADLLNLPQPEPTPELEENLSNVAS